MANRKLMAEVDRTVKKVNEGIENFDELEEKVYSAQSSSQRDKFEGELKKEIKKLQRLRETIRGWISGNEIKDKDLLVEKRQQIETRMERFKKCEQKTKMKAYSKEALSKSQVEKRSRNKQNIIPDSKEKKQAKKWLKDMIETLTNAVDSIEEKIEEEEEKEKKKDGDMIETHRSRQRKHEDYIDKLNQVYEFLDNDEGVTPQDLEELKEYVEYYVDENEEAEFVEDDDSFETIFKKHKEWEESAPKEELVDVDEVKDSIKNSDDYDDEDSDDGFDDDLDSDDDDGSSNVDDDEDLSSPISTSSKDEDKKKKSPPNTTTPPATTTTTTTPPVVNVNPSITKPSGSNLTVTAVVTKEKKITKQAPPAISTTPNQPSTQQPSGQVTPNTTTPTATKPSYSDLVKSPKTPLQPQQPTPSNTTATNATTAATKQPTATTIPTTASTATPTTGSTTPTTTIKKPVVSYIDIAQQNKNAPQGHNLTVSISDSNKQQQVATPTVASTTTPTTTATSKNAKQQATTTATATATKQTTTKAQPAQPTKKAQTNANQSTTPTSTTPIQNISSTPSPTTIDKNNDETFSAGLQPQFGLEDLSSQTQMQQSLFVHQQMHKLQQGGMPMFPQNNMPPSFVSQIQPNQIPSFPQNPTNPILNNNMINNISTPFANDNNSIINSTYMNDMLQSSMKHIPEPYDCNSVYSYIPINENTDFRNEADGFPTESPLTNGLHPLSNPQTYSQLESDTLFFIFYFQQGTYHQYLAAKELKRQAWRYHKKYLTWFQRHDKPTLTTTDYEQGTYVYFDFETLWCQRIKDGFSFEYAFLEDEL